MTLLFQINLQIYKKYADKIFVKKINCIRIFYAILQAKPKIHFQHERIGRRHVKHRVNIIAPA